MTEFEEYLNFIFCSERSEPQISQRGISMDKICRPSNIHVFLNHLLYFKMHTFSFIMLSFSSSVGEVSI